MIVSVYLFETVVCLAGLFSSLSAFGTMATCHCLLNKVVGDELLCVKRILSSKNRHGKLTVRLLIQVAFQSLSNFC